MYADGNERAAKTMVKKAVELYSNSKKTLQNNWEDYALLIMQSGAVIGTYKQTINFYRHHGKFWDNMRIHHIACRVAINLKRYDQALVYSQKSKMPEMTDLITAIQNDCIPWYDFKYTLDEIFHIKKEIETELSPNELMMNLLALFDKHSNETDKAELVYQIILNSGEWGVVFAFKMIERDFFSYKLKAKALDALLKKGVVRSGEKVATVIDGKAIEMMSGFVNIMQEDLISFGLEREVLELHNKGLSNEALLLLQQRVMEIGSTSPSLMKLNAQLFRENGMNEASDQLLKLLDEYMNSDTSNA